jgi:N-acetylmuramoyl-L-alanine amidase
LFPGSKRFESPNFGPRPDGAAVRLIVLHYTAVTCAEALALLCDPAKEVSSHYLISADGEVLNLVGEDQRAWHAGKGWWGAISDVNSHSIGIEIENDGSAPFAARAMRAVEDLVNDLMERHRLPAESVIGHSDLAPVRKTDPGAHFDWQRLARLGLSVWPERGDLAPVEGFYQDAQRFGYGDFGQDCVLSAFRLRFRSGFAGPIDEVDAGLMRRLATEWPSV